MSFGKFVHGKLLTSPRESKDFLVKHPIFSLNSVVGFLLKIVGIPRVPSCDIRTGVCKKNTAVLLLKKERSPRDSKKGTDWIQKKQ